MTNEPNSLPNKPKKIVFSEFAEPQPIIDVEFEVLSAEIVPVSKELQNGELNLTSRDTQIIQILNPILDSVWNNMKKKFENLGQGKVENEEKRRTVDLFTDIFDMASPGLQEFSKNYDQVVCILAEMMSRDDFEGYKSTLLEFFHKMKDSLEAIINNDGDTIFINDCLLKTESVLILLSSGYSQETKKNKPKTFLEKNKGKLLALGLTLLTSISIAGFYLNQRYQQVGVESIVKTEVENKALSKKINDKYKDELRFIRQELERNVSLKGVNDFRKQTEISSGETFTFDDLLIDINFNTTNLDEVISELEKLLKERGLTKTVELKITPVSEGIKNEYLIELIPTTTHFFEIKTPNNPQSLQSYLRRTLAIEYVDYISNFEGVRSEFITTTINGGTTTIKIDILGHNKSASGSNRRINIDDIIRRTAPGKHAKFPNFIDSVKVTSENGCAVIEIKFKNIILF